MKIRCDIILENENELVRELEIKLKNLHDIGVELSHVEVHAYFPMISSVMRKSIHRKIQDTLLRCKYRWELPPLTQEELNSYSEFCTCDEPMGREGKCVKCQRKIAISL